METFLTVIYVLICVFLVLVVLLQSGRGGGLGALSGNSQTVFGGAGAGNFLTRLTSIAAALFMILSITLAYLSSSSESAVERASERLEKRRSAVGGTSSEKKASAKSTKGSATPAAASSTAPDDSTTTAEDSTASAEDSTASADEKASAPGVAEPGVAEPGLAAPDGGNLDAPAEGDKPAAE